MTKHELLTKKRRIEAQIDALASVQRETSNQLDRLSRQLEDVRFDLDEQFAPVFILDALNLVNFSGIETI